MCDLIPTILFQIYYSGFLLAIMLTLMTITIQKPMYEKHGVMKRPETAIVIIFTMLMALLSWVSVMFLVIDLIEFIQRKFKTIKD